MSRKLFLVVTTIVFCGLGTVLSPRSASADVPLRKATIQDLIRQVRLIRQNQAPRPAVKGASMTLGDALSTARSSRADVRFNDGSLTRLGELALFRFTPESRNFYLSNGTMLLLIPPNRGRTNVNTPNASAGIRGSALFVRYDAATDTTVIGALTDNPNGPMDILNKDGSQRQPLKSGQMVVIVRDRIQKLYEFDLKTFYETSELVKGLDLTKEQEANSDAAIAGVQAETSEAFEKQIENPIQGELVQGGYVALSPVKSEYYEESRSVANTPNGSKPSPNISTPETVYKEGLQQPNIRTDTPVDSQPPVNNTPPVVNNTPPVVNNTPPVTPAPTPNQAPVVPPTQQYQPPQSIPNPPAAVQTPVVPPVQAPAPIPIQAPVTPPVQAPAPTPIQAPVTPPVQAPTAIPTPTQAPVVPPIIQQNRTLQSIPNPPAALRQTPAAQTTPQVTPTLAPALAPAASPESPATTGQIQQPVR